MDKLLVTPNLGELELLDKMLKDALSVDETYSLRLYRNDYTPNTTSVLGDFTVATFSGYANKTLSRAGWNAAATVSGKAETDYGTQQSWTASSSETVYGYYVVASTSNVVLWAERFTSSRALSNNDILNLTPKFTLNTEFTI